MMAKSTTILVGKFGAAVGLKGEVRLQSFTAEPGAIAGYKTLALDDGTKVRITALHPQGKMLVARITGVSDRTQAEKLNGRELFIERAELPDTEDENEFYLADLEGLEVRDQHDVVIGKVIAIHDFGAGDILEIRPKAGPTFMIPFTREAVPVVDVAGGYLVHVPLAETVADEEKP